MISIVYHRNRHRVTVEGHAYSGEAGRDLVCSAVSALTYTLAASVTNMFGNDRKKIREVQTKLDSGKAEISCNPVHGFGSVATLMFDTVCTGFDLLQLEYPQYIKYEIRE